MSTYIFYLVQLTFSSSATFRAHFYTPLMKSFDAHKTINISHSPRRFNLKLRNVKITSARFYAYYFGIYCFFLYKYIHTIVFTLCFCKFPSYPVLMKLAQSCITVADSCTSYQVKFPAKNPSPPDISLRFRNFSFLRSNCCCCSPAVFPATLMSPDFVYIPFC